MVLVFAEARYYVLINKTHLERVKNPKQIPPPPHHLLLHLGFLFCQLVSMADADGSRLNLGSPTVPRGRGRPRGSKNKTATDAIGSPSSIPVKRHPSRPVGSNNKPRCLVLSQVQARLLVMPLLLSRGYTHFSVLPARSAMKFNGCR
jgi:hypothetical protein